MLLLPMVLSSNTSHFPRPVDLSSAAGPSTTVLLKLLGCFLFSPCNDSFRSADGAPFLSRKGGKPGPFSAFVLFRGNFCWSPVGAGLPAADSELTTGAVPPAASCKLRKQSLIDQGATTMKQQERPTFLARALSKKGLHD